MEESDVYTEDGTVDIHKNPANKKTTGNWKACRFILGSNPFICFLNIVCFIIYGWIDFDHCLCLLNCSLVNVCCERFAYYGMSKNLVDYLKSRLNQGNATAANNVTNWFGTCYITPLIGAFLADAYLGRYWTIATFVFIYVFVSLIFLLMTYP